MSRNGFNFNMAPMSFEEFKSYWEFGIEIAGVTGGLGTLAWKFDILASIWRVARGRANSADETVALEALSGGGGQQAARAAANVLDRHGHRREARRLDAIRHEASRPTSPSQIV